jgi:hypothetical protein
MRKVIKKAIGNHELLHDRDDEIERLKGVISAMRIVSKLSEVGVIHRRRTVAGADDMEALQCHADELGITVDELSERIIKQSLIGHDESCFCVDGGGYPHEQHEQGDKQKLRGS